MSERGVFLGLLKKPQNKPPQKSFQKCAVWHGVAISKRSSAGTSTIQTSSIEQTKYYTTVAGCSSLNEPGQGVGLQEAFTCVADSKDMVRFLSFGQGQRALLFTLFCDIFNLSLYQSFLCPSPGSPVLIFSFSHTFLCSVSPNVLLLIPCPRSIISRTILAFHVYMLPFLPMFFFLDLISHFHGVCCNLDWGGAISLSLLPICSQSPTKNSSWKKRALALPASNVLLAYLCTGWWWWPVTLPRSRN